ncbi:RNA polymerase sigma factor [Fibrivirga algicola]|uniref:Sigma-70 family RNA polymerase sigma factor n=1 Tax=Fibrivirga algicola TaxID=2950420 RepID=A0ABX0QIC1_9BACT|nr:sigma-70 family RNA polymerase sigma factor [Fibrivirga algicola]ARK12660.1 RNA polymerase subunit sigma-24 [Fibrella sp. ES10-3-2-2]NID12174.1 sigma-70 family RNA polymerase sigma factor [Fibrivirga algicola]
MDLHAFKQRILPVQNRLFRLATLFLRNREDAEDALQDVLMRLWSNRQQLDTYQSVEALAVQMTRNLCLDRLKSHARQKSVDQADLGNVPTEQLSPYRQTELTDSASQMRRLIDELPDAQKLVLHLRDVEEYSFEEIEQVTGLSINAIRVTLSRARQRLRDGYLKLNDYEAGY